MSNKVQPGEFITIEMRLLEPGERSQAVPEDTMATPLLARVSGFATEPTGFGEQTIIMTRTGRNVTGTVINTAPAYTHDFGRLDPTLSSVAPHLREWKENMRGTHASA